MLCDDRALGGWLASAVLEPLGCRWRIEAAPPELPEADAVVLALGSALSREETAPALARRWEVPVVALLGRVGEDGELLAAGVRPVRWPYAPLQIQEALLRSLGVDPAARRRPAPEAPQLRRRKDRGRRP